MTGRVRRVILAAITPALGAAAALTVLPVAPASASLPGASTGVAGAGAASTASTTPEQRLVAALRASRASAPYRFGTTAFNKWYARNHLARVYRGNLTQFRCLERLWQRESHWNHRAVNPNGKYLGIPQNTRSTIRAAGFSEAAFRANPEIQVQVGLRYIRGRYGTPCAAWAHSQRAGWY